MNGARQSAAPLICDMTVRVRQTPRGLPGNQHDEPAILGGVKPLVFVVFAACMLAEDWPEWRGRGRLGVWNETGILDSFPGGGLKAGWRAPVCAGLAGPAVGDGRVFGAGFPSTGAGRGVERAVCLDEQTGKVLWTHEWEAVYHGLATTYASGPRATPTVDGDRVYVLGAMGALSALDVRTGEVLWKHDFVKEFGTRVPVWGITGAPLVDGERVICLAGGENNSKVIAFDRKSGAVIWRALSSEGEPGYSAPFLLTAAGRKQVII